MTSNILIVDDSLTVRMDLGETFRLAGFMTTLCSTVAEARNALSLESFSLIILDVVLPDADGLEFLAEIKSSEVTASTPVILLSSESEVRDRIRGRKTGADEYIGKPYDPPYLVARAWELLRSQSQEREQPRSTTILVIDDSLTFREELKSELETAGYTVIAAESGEDGLHIAVRERPSAIIVDGLLPGIDGATVIRQIRADAALRRTPCILLTASAERNSEIKALDAGADDYVRKDESTQVVLTRIAAILRSSGAAYIDHTTSSLHGPKKVLAVDDSLTYLHEVVAQLKQEGYEVIPARSGEEALDLLSVEPVDCILLDLVMPGLSGQETCRRIKSSSTWRDIPLIMHTALEEPEAMIEGINAGADDYIAKSNNSDVLRARVRAQLRRKQFEDENRSFREQLLQKELEVVSANAARELAETRAACAEELELKNKELESFSYSVSHDLRAPLRAIAGFTQVLIEDYQVSLSSEGRQLLEKIAVASSRMGQLINDLLKLAKTARGALARQPVNLSTISQEILLQLQESEPNRRVTFVIAPMMMANGDPVLLRAVLENLMGNAWKFTGKQPNAHIEVGTQNQSTRTIYFVRDNGAGFDKQHAHKLFGTFQRLHKESEFPGTGIGLATVQRIIQHHGGRIWAESEVGCGATFHFTLENNKKMDPENRTS